MNYLCDLVAINAPLPRSGYSFGAYKMMIVCYLYYMEYIYEEKVPPGLLFGFLTMQFILERQSSLPLPPFFY